MCTATKNFTIRVLERLRSPILDGKISPNLIPRLDPSFIQLQRASHHHNHLRHKFILPFNTRDLPRDSPTIILYANLIISMSVTCVMPFNLFNKVL